jgi:transposase
MPDFLKPEQVADLKQAHKQIRDKRSADRVKAVLMLNRGFSPSQVAQALLLDETTVSRYRKQYRRQDLKGLLQTRYFGGKTTLTAGQEAELKEYLQGNTKRTAREAADWIKKTYRVKFSVAGVTKLLHRLGFTYKKPRIVPGKADRLKQEEFLRKYEEIKQGLSFRDQIYFADAAHPQHNPRPSCGWILKGKDNDKLVKTNSGRERLNLSGALSLKEHTAIVLEEKTINSSSTIRLLKKLAIKQPGGKIYLVLDNAAYYHSRQVKAWLKKHRRFKFLYLPSYSPNLNLIERLWRFFHAKVTWNRYFETLKEFRRVTLKFFRNLQKYKPELDTLLADNFQLVPAVNLQT